MLTPSSPTRRQARGWRSRAHADAGHGAAGTGKLRTGKLPGKLFSDAADQAGQSRRWGGIHVPEDDYDGRLIGAQAGQQAWELARKYFDGSVATTAPPLSLTLLPANRVELTWAAVRGLRYQVQTCPDVGSVWETVATQPPATDTLGRWTGPRVSATKGFYRIRQLTTP